MDHDTSSLFYISPAVWDIKIQDSVAMIDVDYGDELAARVRELATQVSECNQVDTDIGEIQWKMALEEYRDWHFY